MVECSSQVAHEPRRRWITQLGLVLGLTAASLLIMSSDDAVNGGWERKTFLVGRMAVLIAVCTLFLRQEGETWSELGLRRPRPWWKVPILVAGGFGLLLVTVLVITNQVLPALGAPPPRPSAKIALRGDLSEYLFWAIPVAWGSAAFGEELLLRGFVLDRFAKLIGSSSLPATLCAIMLQALVFGAFHLYQGVAGGVIAGAIGTIMGLIWLAGGRNLWPCFLLHGLADFISYTDKFTAAAS
jgi:hypothetical protein